MKFKMPLLIVLGGYVSSLVFFLIWYFMKWGDSFYENNLNSLNVDVVVILICITVLYFFLFLLICCIESFQKFWPSFTFVSTITVLTFFLVPFGYYQRNYESPVKRLSLKQDDNGNMFDLCQKKKSDLVGSKNLSHEVIKRETSQKDGVQKRLEVTKEEPQTEASHKKLIEAKLNENVSGIKSNSKTGSIDSDRNNQEIIFRVQILCSDNRLPKDSPRFKNLRDVWEYKDGELYKYTVGNIRNLKSASALKSELRGMGFSEAFVVSFKNGKRIPVREALKLMD